MLSPPYPRRGKIDTSPLFVQAGKRELNDYVHFVSYDDIEERFEKDWRVLHEQAKK